MLKTRKSLRFVLAFLWMPLVGYAGTTAVEAPKVTEKVAKKDQSFLWKVKSEQSTVYLLGSIHVATKAMYPLKKRITDAFEKSDHLVVEVDTEAHMADMQKLMMAKGIYLPPDGLSKHLDEETKAQLDKYLEEKKVPPPTRAQMEQLKPWVIGIQLVMMEAASMGLDPKIGIDATFLGLARNKKKILELETMASQIDLLSGGTEALQLKMLKQNLSEVSKMKEQLGKMINAWVDGDVSAMEKFIFEERSKTPELKPFWKKMFDDRNVKMVEKIEGYLKKKGTYFVIAGAGHYMGKMGIIELLKAKKHKVTRE